jgi:hypothetical protein
LNDDVVPIPCDNESNLAHLSKSVSEMSDSTICEIECIHLESESDTPHELSEDILISNHFTSTPLVLSFSLIGSMEYETPILEAMVPHMDDKDAITKNDEDVTYMEATTTSTPTSPERDYKGNNIGVDDDAIIQRVDMMTDTSQTYL